jgi:hypothetical protein
MHDTLTRYVSNEQRSESLPWKVGASKQHMIRKLLFHFVESIVSMHIPYPSWTRSG